MTSLDEQLAAATATATDARRRPGRRLGAASCGRGPARPDRLARRDGRPGHGAHERRDRGRRVDLTNSARTTSGSRTSRSTLHPDQLPLRPARQGGRESSGSPASSSSLPPATRARAAERTSCLRARERPVRDHGRCARHQHSSRPTRRADAPWSAYGYTLDGFAKPELSAPGRAIVGAGAGRLDAGGEKPAQVITPGRTCSFPARRSSAPVVSGIAAQTCWRCRPTLTPDQVKGALMLKARALRKVRTLAAGVGEVVRAGRGRGDVARRTPTARSTPSSCPIRRRRDGLRRRLLARCGQGLAQLGRGLVAGRFLGRRLVVATSPGRTSPGRTCPGATSRGRTSRGPMSPGTTSPGRT